MTSEQVTEWQAYDEIEPIGANKNDWYRTAVLLSNIINLAMAIYGKKGQGRKQISYEEFLPGWAKEDKVIVKQTIADMKNIMMSFARVHNKNVLRKKLKNTPPKKLAYKRNRGKGNGPGDTGSNTGGGQQTA